MRSIIIKIVFVMLLFCSIAGAAENWDIYNDAVIQDGNQFNNVRVFDTPPDHTTVDMTGGLIDSVSTYDESTFNISGGYVSSFLAYNSSSVNATGGEVYGLYALDTSVIHVLDDVVVHTLHVDNNGLVNMSGGIVDHAGSMESGILNLSGGLVSDHLWTYDSGIINIFGYNLVKFPTGGHYGYGFVTGQWDDWTSFNIDLNGSETYLNTNLHEIPEPGTGFLIALGMAVIRRKHRRRIQINNCI